MLQGKVQLEGFAEMYFCLWEGKNGPWLQLTKSFKMGDKWANAVWCNKNPAMEKVLDLLVEEYRKQEVAVANDAAKYALPDTVAISEVDVSDIPF